MTRLAPLRILLLCHSFNSLSQRLLCELRSTGHEVSVELDIADRVTEEAVAMFRPDLVIAPFLKRMIPASVWQQHVCLIVHPGPVGDRGPSALDWAVLERRTEWGVTVLQATGDFDAGPVWAHAAFPMRGAAKGSLYRKEVTAAAVACVLRATERFVSGSLAPSALSGAPSGALQGGLPDAAESAAPQHIWRPAMRQHDRRIDWARDTTQAALAKVRSADGQPGVADEMFGVPCHLYDAHPATQRLLDSLPADVSTVMPGSVLGRRDTALLRRTVDGAVWIGQARNPQACGDGPAFKLPCALAFAESYASLAPLPAELERDADEWAEVRYQEFGPARARVGCLSFDFYNGAMSTDQCERLLAALRHARQRDTRVLLLMGGADFFSNGIHLNCIEAAAHRLDDSAADESWRNINAMNDVALELITTTDRLTVSVLRGNAGAGGAFLALAADEVWAHRGVVLNPHYKNMGNLYGSEYWTYLLPRRLGPERAAALMQRRLPILAREALVMGLIDRCVDSSPPGFESEAITHALALAASHNVGDRIAIKQRQRSADEAARPLADHRKDELSRMHRNFYGFDPSYHVARYHFVHKLPHAWTPRHLAVHRDGPGRGAPRP